MDDKVCPGKTGTSIHQLRKQNFQESQESQDAWSKPQWSGVQFSGLERRCRNYTWYGWILPTHLYHTSWYRKPWISTTYLRSSRHCTEILRPGPYVILHQGLCHKLVTSWSWNTNGMHNIPITFCNGHGNDCKRSWENDWWITWWKHPPPMNAFMDDITCLVRSSKSTSSLLHSRSKLIKWARMKFKAAKSRSVSLTKGRVSSQSFTIDDEHIPTLQKQQVKCLGGGTLCHWLTDTVERRYTKV